MNSISRLRHFEPAVLDRVRIEELVHDLGEPGAERLVGRSLDSIAVHLGRLERAWRSGRLADLAVGAGDLARIADEIGLASLGRVARDVARNAGTNDVAAIAATVMRMVRVGEASLMSIWDLRDGSI